MLRLPIKIFGILIISIFVLGLLFLKFLLTPVFREKWRLFLLRFWGRAMAWCLGMEMHVSGGTQKEPHVLVSNHLSYVDIIFFAAQNRIICVSKKEVRNWPLLGILGILFETIYIDRQKRRDILRVNKRIEKALLEGKSVLFFPEATSTNGKEILPFKSGLFEPAVRGSYPVYTGFVTYRINDNNKQPSDLICWWGEMTFLPHAKELLKLKKFSGYLYFNEQEIVCNNRKVMAKECRDRIISLFESIK